MGENPFSALSFSSLYIWQDYYGLTIGGTEDFFVVRTEDEQDRGYYAPCGNPEKCEAFLKDTLRGKNEENAWPVHFLFYTQEQATALERLGFRAAPRDDLYEYVYSRQALALQGGHTTESYRRKCKKYARENSYSVRFLEEEDLPAISALTDAFEQTLPTRERVDIPAIRTAIRGFRESGSSGMVMETPDKVPFFFILGYPVSETMYTMTVSKRDPKVPREVTAAGIMEFSKLLEEKYDEINLEEDLGLEGLRKIKQLYGPIRMQEVWEIWG